MDEKVKVVSIEELTAKYNHIKEVQLVLGAFHQQLVHKCKGRKLLIVLFYLILHSLIIFPKVVEVFTLFTMAVFIISVVFLYYKINLPPPWTGYCASSEQADTVSIPRRGVVHRYDRDPTQYIEEFRTMLYQLNVVMDSLCQHVNIFYIIFKWKNPHLTIICYMSTCLVVTSLLTLPMYTNILLLMDSAALYLWKKREICEWLARMLVLDIQGPQLESHGESTETKIPLQADRDKEDVASKVGSCDADSVGKEEDAHQEQGDGRSDIKQLVDTKVAKEKEGSYCFECGTTFVSLLRRRVYCRNCGQHFCAQCCSHKIAKAVIGVTAPGAMAEQVLVCLPCHINLMGRSGT